ncbi:MAG: hypothetical protein ABIF92_02865 [archaeon]
MVGKIFKKEDVNALIDDIGDSMLASFREAEKNWNLPPVLPQNKEELKERAVLYLREAVKGYYYYPIVLFIVIPSYFIVGPIYALSLSGTLMLVDRIVNVGSLGIGIPERIHAIFNRGTPEYRLEKKEQQLQAEIDAIEQFYKLELKFYNSGLSRQETKKFKELFIFLNLQRVKKKYQEKLANKYLEVIADFQTVLKHRPAAKPLMDYPTLDKQRPFCRSEMEFAALYAKAHGFKSYKHMIDRYRHIRQKSAPSRLKQSRRAGIA